jgi:hypothetical protein
VAKKKGKKKENKAVVKPADTQPKQDADSENPFDFGGLPYRDLKKNLGCG